MLVSLSRASTPLFQCRKRGLKPELHEQQFSETPGNLLLGNSEFCCWELLKCYQMLLSAAVCVGNTSAIADSR